MSKWKWLSDLWTWKCPECGFKWSDTFEGMFDDSELDPIDFGMNYCPHCGENLSGDTNE